MGVLCVIFVIVTAMMLSGAKVRMEALHRLDTMYSQYLAASRQIGELKASIEKMDGYFYHYIAVPSARNNILASIKQETNSIDQIIMEYKGKDLAPEEKKLISDLDTAWIEMQRGYKEIMKVADGGKNDEVSRLLADGSYLSKARKNTLAAVRNLNDYNASRNEAAIKANATSAQEVGRAYCGYFHSLAHFF